MTIRIYKYKIIFDDGRQETVTGIGTKKDILDCAKKLNVKIKKITRMYKKHKK